MRPIMALVCETPTLASARRLLLSRRWPPEPLAEAAPHDPLEVISPKPLHFLGEHGHTLAIGLAQAR
jgi:hypothetical protein